MTTVISIVPCRVHPPLLTTSCHCRKAKSAASDRPAAEVTTVPSSQMSHLKVAAVFSSTVLCILRDPWARQLSSPRLKLVLARRWTRLGAGLKSETRTCTFHSLQGRFALLPRATQPSSSSILLENFSCLLLDSL